MPLHVEHTPPSSSIRTHALAVGLVLLGAVLGGCEPADRYEADAPDVRPTSSSSDPYVVEVTARDYVFQAPAEIPSGWTTFRLVNEGAETHFMLIYSLPEGKTYEDVKREVAAPFDQALAALHDGSADRQAAGEILLDNFPDWSAGITYLGGPGFVSPGRTAEATVHLEPGTYVIECYVKMPDGRTFHSSHGMAQQLDVTAEPNGAPEPEADLRMSVSSNGLSAPDELAPGRHTIRLDFEDQTPHENFLGHDVHLVQVEDDTDLDEVARWMDWMEVEGLRGAGPAEFLGGSHDMPAGETAYFTIDVEPGRYAWIAEVTNPAEKGLLKTFSVPEEGGTR